MPIILLISISSITVALLSYIAVFWMNKRAGTFNWSQMMVLVLGVSTDVLGTAMMKMLSEKVTYDLHTILGYGALVLMLIMAAFGLYALVFKKKFVVEKFGKYYLLALIVWVLSYATGVYLGIEKLSS